MIISFTGAHGVGKTTTCRALCEVLGGALSIFDDYYRIAAPMLGYKSPMEILDETPLDRHLTTSGMAGAALGAMNEWICQLSEHGMIDLEPPSQIAYHFRSMAQMGAMPCRFLLKLAEYLCSKIDLFVYLPTVVIPLVGDDMRSDDPADQLEIEGYVQKSIDVLGIPEQRLCSPQSSSGEGRVEEVMACISKLS